MKKIFITCGIVFIVLYINNIFQILPEKWKDLLFNVEFILLIGSIINMFKREKGEK